VIADALTSALAIVALLGGRYLGWSWLDPLTALLGAAVILQWSAGLARSTALTLLDVDAEQRLAAEVRAALGDEAKIEALHAWSTGGAQRACMLRVAVPSEAHARGLHTRLAALRFAPLVVETRIEPGA
jgi:Co/Zn/Cd efflux system component